MIYIKYQSNSFPVIDRQLYIFWNIRLHFRLRVDLLSTKHAYGWTLGQQLIMPCWDPTLLSFQGAIHTKTHPPFQGSLLFKFTRLILFSSLTTAKNCHTFQLEIFNFTFQIGFFTFPFQIEIPESIRQFLSTAWRSRSRFNINIFIETRNIYFNNYVSLPSLWCIKLKS